ncbi:polyprenyl diphosphate synthase [Gammaproteobacteria bacterium]|nr:polyprenyl diphosphate synthase [Gammaproteobacteria bacterium]
MIMDGNRRWARAKHLPVLKGHEAGLKALLPIVDHCIKKKIESLTLFALSCENLERSKVELTALLGLLPLALEQHLESLAKRNVCIQVLGDQQGLPAKTRSYLTKITERTKNGKGLQLTLAFNYSGRWHIQQAVSKCQNADSTLESERCLDGFLRVGRSDPDLLIRTGGERRLSNFLLYQMAYTELYFTPVLWPDFTIKDFDDALHDFSQRERRFGTQ